MVGVGDGVTGVLVGRAVSVGVGVGVIGVAVGVGVSIYSTVSVTGIVITVGVMVCGRLRRVNGPRWTVLVHSPLVPCVLI